MQNSIHTLTSASYSDTNQNGVAVTTLLLHAFRGHDPDCAAGKEQKAREGRKEGAHDDDDDDDDDDVDGSAQRQSVAVAVTAPKRRGNPSRRCRRYRNRMQGRL